MPHSLCSNPLHALADAALADATPCSLVDAASPLVDQPHYIHKVHNISEYLEQQFPRKIKSKDWRLPKKSKSKSKRHIRTLANDVTSHLKTASNAYTNLAYAIVLKTLSSNPELKK